MMSQLISALIKDLLLLLSKEPQFFKNKIHKAEGLLKFLSGTSERAFIEDMRGALLFLRDGIVTKENAILKAISDYLIHDFPAVFDRLDSAFYRLPLKDQKQQITQLIPGKEYFFEVVRSLLLIFSSQEVTEHITAWTTVSSGSPEILVQSPLECDLATKQEIRTAFLKRYPKSFVSFHVSRQLIGGIRFFIDGKVQDYSWFSQLQKIRNLSLNL